MPGLQAMWRHLSTYRRELLTVSCLGTLIAITDGITPYIGGRLIDSIIDPYKISLLGKLVFAHILLLSVWGLVQIFVHILNWYNSRMSRKIGMLAFMDYLANSFSHLLEVPISFHKSRKMGDIQERIQRAGSELDNIASTIIADVGPQFLTFIVATIITFSINILLGIVLLTGVAVYTSIMFSLTRPISVLSKARNKAFRGVWHLTWEALGNVQAIKQAVTEESERNKIKKGFTQVALSAWLRIFNLWQNLSLIQRSIILITQILIYIISIKNILAGSMSIGELVMFNSYAAMMFGPFVALGRNWQTVQSGIIAIEQAEKLVTHPKEDYKRGGLSSIERLNGEVEFRHVSFRYAKGKEVLSGVSFLIPAGKTIALVGESGVGKSTLIDLISGYYFPNRGTVLVDGLSTRKHDLHRLRSNMAVVSQEVVLFNDTIYNNIRYGNFKATRELVIEAALKAHALEFIEKFPNKWKQVVGERGIKLSVGQKQRVAIARAILRNPRILILDEPTSALDAISEHKIQASLVELMRGRTTFIVAHRLSTVRHADKIIVLENGKIVEEGTHDQLLSKETGVYRHLYELQTGFRE